MNTVRKEHLIGGAVIAAVLALPFSARAAQLPDGVMGQSLVDETVYDTPDPGTAMYSIPGKSQAPSKKGTNGYTADFLSDSFTSEGEYTDATYYHKSEYEDYTLLNGIDVSWWQSGGKGSTGTNIDWSQAADAGISYAFVRVASRDSADGTIYEDTSADAHIQGALDNDMKVGLYIFSQALDEEEAEEEAQYVLDLVEAWDWDVTMPIVLDREAGSYKRLTAGMLSKSEETDICNAFSQVISDAGYRPMVYASYSWINNYIDTDSLEDNGCAIWIARYNNTTTSNAKSGVPYGDVPYDYEFWQYSSTGRVDGYSGNLDVDFWYKDTGIKTNNLQMTANASDSITLKWSKAGDAPMYRVYRYDEDQEKYVAIKNTSKTSFTDTDVKAGKTYKYRVRGYWTFGGVNYYGRYSADTEMTTLPARVGSLQADSRTSTTVTLDWKSVNGATAYRIYQYSEDSEKFEKLAEVGPDVTEFKVAGLAGAKEYQFKVRVVRKFEGTNYYGSYSAVLSTVTAPKKTTGAAAETASSTEIDISWDKVTRASGYRVYRLNKDTGKYQHIATVKGNKTFDYTDTGLKSASEYSYRVRAYVTYDGTNYYGSYCDVVSAVTKPAKVKGLSLTTKSSSVTVSWNRLSGVTGYRVYRLNPKTGKYEKIATVKGASAVSYRDTSVKKGTTYTYKVRAYKAYNGTNYYGSYSATASVKAK